MLTPRAAGQQFAERTHPRVGGLVGSLVVLVLAAALGVLLAAGLLHADRTSWSGSFVGTATVTGRSDTGVTATVRSQQVSLHLAHVPAPGTRLVVEVRPDGRARPISFRQTWTGALQTGLGLLVGLALVVQVYRYFVTRRATDADVRPTRESVIRPATDLGDDGPGHRSTDGE